MSAPITLEPIAPHHAEDVQRLAAHPEVVATTNLPDPYPDDGAAQWIEYVRPRHAAGEEFAFAIRNEDDALVGVTGLVDVTDTEAELGFWIGKPYWNRGYATAAARQTVRFAFEELAVEHVFARPLARNAPSRRVLEKLGFRFQQPETHEHPKWTDDDRVARYTLDRDNWHAVE
jgi:RimJ/RimL family protein N-acetyltransferase